MDLHTGNHELEFWDMLQINLNMTNETPGAIIIIIGDLNADPFTPDGKKLFEFVSVNGLTTHITNPTGLSLTKS